MSPMTCTFPNGFDFGDTSYNCTISVQGTAGAADSYVKTSSTKITIYSSVNAKFSYTCMR